MSPPDEPHFDGYADRYRELHRDSVRGSGEEPDYFAAYKVAWMARKLRAGGKAAGLRVLDFGCGIGNAIPHFERHFPQAGIIGVDVSGRSIELARQAHRGARFERIEGTRIPLPDGSVDVAMAACVYHHL